MLPYLLLTGLLLACICRSLHYNPYGDYMIRLADTLAQDAKHYQDPCILSAGKNRLAYYSGLPVIDLFGTQDVPETEKTRIREIFYSYPVQKAETVYFVLSEYAADQPGTTLTELPASARQFCTFIDEFYRDTRKKRLSRLFRFDLKDLYRVTLTDFDGWKLTELPKEKIIYEAGFTRKQTSSFYRNTYQFFDENSSSLAKPDLKDFPIGWIVKGTPGFSSPAELGMHVSDNGNTVFRLKSRDLITAYSTTLLAVPTEEGGEWLVEYLVSGGEPDTEFTLAFHCYQGSTYKGMMSLPGRTLKEQSGNRQLYQALIPSDTFGDADTVRVTLLLQHGELFIHGLRISRAEKQ